MSKGKKQKRKYLVDAVKGAPSAETTRIRGRIRGGSGGQELLYTLSAQYIPSKIVIHA